MNGDQESPKTSKSVQSASHPTGTQKRKLTQERLKELLSYDPETGIFTRLNNGTKWRVGDEAGGDHHSGYRYIRVDGETHAAHRLAWLYVYGYLPEYLIDHINRAKADNRIINLREVSKSCNVRNSKTPINNILGVKGVVKSGSKWVAHIRVNNKTKFLGCYFTKLAAAEARVKAENEYNYTMCDISSEAKKFVDSCVENSTSDERKLAGEAKSKLMSRNRSGITGVRFYDDSRQWMVMIYTGGKNIYLGCYKQKLDAAKARYEAEIKYGVIKSGEVSSAKKFIMENDNGKS